MDFLRMILPNLEEEEDEETPYKVKISPDLWAHAMAGGRLPVTRFAT